MNLVNLTGARLVLLSVPTPPEPPAPDVPDPNATPAPVALGEPEELVLEATEPPLTLEWKIDTFATTGGDGSGIELARQVPRGIQNLPKLPQPRTLFIVTEDVFRALTPRLGLAYPDASTAKRSPSGEIVAYRRLVVR